MDKRTFLFVLALSLALLSLNLFFQSYNSQKKQEWLDQQKIKEVAKNIKTDEAIQQRTDSPSSFPVAQIFSDAKQENLLTSGIIVQGALLTLSWDNTLPNQVYVLLPESDELQKWTLIFSQKGMGTPVVYGSQENQTLPVGQLPGLGRFDLQMITFNKNMQHPIGVTLGELTDGHFTLPRNGLKNLKTDEKGNPLHYTAIAFFKLKDSYLPIGFYDSKQDTLVPIQNITNLQPFVKAEAQEFKPSVQKKSEESFYVLENEFQQLVFSNFGGALAEINLPFQTKQDPASIVREIEFDREMVAQHPYNAMFPAHPYYTPSQSSTSKDFEKHATGKLGGYYPLLRRDLIQKDKKLSVTVKPPFYALNIVSEYPEVAELIYEVKEFTSRSITFEAVQSHRRITKTYSLGEAGKEGPYCLNLEIKIEGDSRGLWLTSGVPEVEWISGGPAPALKYRITRNQKPEVTTVDLPKDAMTITSVYPDWVCDTNGFLGMIMDPLTEIDPGFRVQYVSGTAVPSRLTELDQEYQLYKAANLPGYMTLLPLKSQGGITKMRFFAGPFAEDLLKKIDQLYSDPKTGYNPDYISCQTTHGWFTFISEPFAKFLLVLLKFFHYVTGSWAFSIVLLTISLRILLYPLNAWSTKSMVRMQQIAPEVTAIQDKYKKDPKKAQMEVMSLYRDKGINPISGCLPLVIQMPFLIGMFDLLKSSFALRGAPFIPGWIDDLTAPDVLFSWNYPIFFIGNEFHLLPVLLGVVMFVQQRFFSNTPKDEKLMTDQQRQQKAMGTMMSAVFAIMFYNFPSGLNIYWLSSMLLGMAQQWYTTKQLQNKPIVLPAKANPKRAK